VLLFHYVALGNRWSLFNHRDVRFCIPQRGQSLRQSCTNPKLSGQHNHSLFFTHNEFCHVRQWLGVKGFAPDNAADKLRVRVHIW
jgi:hypothetical protein